MFKKHDAFLVLLEDVKGGMTAVSIGPSQSKILINDQIVSGENNFVPTMTEQVGDKLFYWRDTLHSFNQATLDVFYKYDLVEFDSTGLQVMPSHRIDESQKAIHYYFCQNDHSYYRKVKTNTAIGWYNPPKLTCPPNE